MSDRMPWDDWTDDEIRAEYDEHPDLLLSDFAQITRRSVAELKRILMPGRDEK